VRLFEAIVAANQSATAAGPAATVVRDEFAGSLPLVALTCIDVRLNHLFPGALGIHEEDFIWLRNAGNIIFDSMSSMTRTLALACAVKGGREIAVIGHTDCRVRATPVGDLIERFRELGIERSKLPDNLVEFFGLFASERQNVINAAGHIRQSPLISPKVPVHGLLIDIQTGRLEWIVNGYQTLEAATVQVAAFQGAQPAFSPEMKTVHPPASQPMPSLAEQKTAGAPPKIPDLPPNVRRFLGGRRS
jgi:carbonic anhydrase